MSGAIKAVIESKMGVNRAADQYGGYLSTHPEDPIRKSLDPPGTPHILHL